MGSSPETLARNIEALEHALGDQVRLPADASGSTNDPGAPAAVYMQDERGNPLLYHSARDPIREAERALQSAVGADVPSLVIVIGAGLGYLPEVIGRQFPDARVLVIEPEPTFVRQMLSRHDWRPALTSGRLLILLGPDYAGSSAAWRMVDGRAPVVIEHPVLTRARPAAIEEGRSVVKRILYDARANAEARERFEGPYLVNTLQNVPVLAREANAAALDSRFQRVPAVIVAAGPSLDRRLDDLRAIQDRVVMVAVDTAARPLLSSGVRPHLVVAVDPSAHNARHLEGLPPDPGTWLVAECSLHPTAFESFSGRTFCFRVAEHEPWPWLRAAGLDAGLLRAWGSVLTTAFDLALRMGCDPIVFVGADLAYTDDRPYCRDTIYEEDWAQETSRGQDLRAVWRQWMPAHASREAAVDGREAVTSARLVAFRGWLVESAARAQRRVINATGGGILRGGSIEELTPRQAIELTGPPVDRSALEAIWRSSASPSTRERAAARALDELQRGARPEVIARWRGICETSGLDLDGVLSATARRLATHDARSLSQVTVHLLEPRLPERLALFRSFVQRDTPPEWLSETRHAVSGRSFGDGMRRAALALRDAVSEVPSGLAAVPPNHVYGSLPLTAWTGTDLRTSRGWLRFEGELGAVLADHPALLPRMSDPLLAIHETRWADEPSEGSATIASESLACAALLEWAMVAAAGDREAGIDIAAAGLFDVLDREARTRLLGAAALSIAANQVTGEALDGSDSVTCRLRLDVDGGDTSIGASTAVRTRYLMRGLTGLLLEKEARSQPGVARRPDTHRLTIEGGGVRWRLDLDPAGESAFSRTRFLAATRAAPRTLLGDQLPRCLAACTLNAREAVLGAVHSHKSFALDEEGHVRPLSTWPRPMIAEVPWGTEGGALAWNAAEEGSYMMLRRDASAEPEISPVPFGPSWPLVEADGRTLWSSYFGGLWSWHPDGSARLEADIPPTLGIRREAADVRLDPVTTDEYGTVRMPLYEALLWHPSTGRVDPLALGPEGVSWSISVDAGWTAEGHPHADLVRIISPGGRAFELACYYPFSVAWAGRSLVVVSTTTSVVLFFPHLRDVLEAWP
jgi:hypothetical protein